MKTFLSVLFANLATVAIVAMVYLRSQAEDRAARDAATLQQMRVTTPHKVVTIRNTKFTDAPFDVRAGREFSVVRKEGSRYIVTNGTNENRLEEVDVKPAP